MLSVESCSVRCKGVMDAAACDGARHSHNDDTIQLYAGLG